MDLYYIMMGYYHRLLSWDLQVMLHKCVGKHTDWKCTKTCYYFPKRLQFLNVNTVILNSSALSLACRRSMLEGVCEHWWIGLLHLEPRTAGNVRSRDLLYHRALVVNNMVLYTSKTC